MGGALKILLTACLTLASTAFAFARADLETKDYIVKQSVRYDADSCQKRVVLNLYVPKAKIPADGFPCLLLIHGGAWQCGDENSEHELADFFVKKGFLVATPTYRFLPEYSLYDCVYDCKKALFWLKKNARQYGGNPDKTAVMGGSAGGHLSLMLALTSKGKFCNEANNDNIDDSVSVCVAFAAPTTLEVVREYFKNAPKSLPHLKDCSPITYADKSASPILLMHSKDDNVVPILQSRELFAKMQEKGAAIKFVELNSAIHPFWFKYASTNPFKERMMELLSILGVKQEEKPPYITARESAFEFITNNLK